MYCIYCGKPTEGENDTCPSCAAAHGHTEPVQPQYQPESFELNTPVRKPSKKKGKGGPVALLIAVVVIAACALVAILNWNSLQEFYILTFASPKDYMMHVEEKNLDNAIDELTNTYGNMLDSMEKTSGAGTAEMHILLGDNLITMLEMAMAQSSMEMDLDFLKDILLDMDTNVAEQEMQADLGIGLGAQRILTLSMFLNLADNGMWMGIPELSGDYLFVDLEDATGTDISSTAESIASAQSMYDSLPDAQMLNEMLKKYYRIALEHVNTVEKSTASLQVGAIAADMNVITATIYEKDLAQMCVSLLNTLNADAEAKSAIASFMKAAFTVSPQYDYIWNEDTGRYEEITLDGSTDTGKMVEDWIAEGLQTLETAIEDSSEENFITVVTYVDTAGSVAGRAISVSGQEEQVRYLTLWQDDSFAFEADLAQAQVSGTGTRSGDLLSGEYTVYADDQALVTVQLQGWNEKDAEAGYPSGAIRIIPSQDTLDSILYDLDSSVAAMIGSQDLALKLTMECTKTGSDIALDIEMNGERFLGFTVSGGETKSEAISFPTDTLDATDEDALQAWILAMDFTTVLANMRAAGIPSELVDSLESLVGMISQYA